MLTAWLVTAGFLLLLGVGGFVFEKSGLVKLFDRFFESLPMHWADLSMNDEDCTPYQ